MEHNFVAGNLSAAPGTKTQGWLQVANSAERLPVTLINGTRSGKTAVITAGVHGGEYPGIEAAIRLANVLDPSEVGGRIAIVSCANQGAFFAKAQYVNPLDGKNLNRSFPGKALGTLSERIAYAISSELFGQADLFMDLHSGDIHENLMNFVLYSLIGSAEQVAEAREMASLLGVPYVVGSTSATGSFGSAASVGVPGILGEIGCCGRWNERDVTLYTDGVLNLLRHAGILQGEVRRQGCSYMKRMAVANAGTTGVWHPFVEPGQLVRQGEKLGEIVDLFGAVVESHVAPCQGPVLYVASSLAICAQDPLAAVGDPE